MRVIAHIDMDAFFASVEQLDFPELRGKPVVIGGSPFAGRSVVSSASYEARKFGIRSAMPINRAYRLCSHAVFRNPRFHRYEQLFWQISKILLRFSPAVELASIDEAFIDLTGTERLSGDPVETARRIKNEIRDETRLVASIGIAPNKVLAKIASELGKPNGFIVVTRDKVRDFLDPLPVNMLFGIGAKFAEKLEQIGIHKVADVLKFNESVLQRLFGKSGSYLYRISMGIDDSEVTINHQRKSIGAERTFEKDIIDRAELRQKLILICDNVAQRMVEEKLAGRTITLKARYSDFSTLTRSNTLATPIRSHRKMLDCAYALLKRIHGGALRLLGVSMSNLSPALDVQKTLLHEKLAEDEALMRTIVEIREKFGTYGIVRGFELDDKQPDK